MVVIEKFKIVIIVVAACVLTSCYDYFDSDGAAVKPSLDMAPNITIKTLHEMLKSERLDIHDNLVVMGSITANDRSGNIYNSFFMEADNYAIEVLEGRYDSHVQRVEGYRTIVNLKGLSIAKEDGVLQVGLKSSYGSFRTLEYIGADVLINRHIANSFIYKEIEPSVRNISTLTEQMCGTIVEVGELTHVPSADDTQPYVWRGDQCFIDSKGQKIWSSTSDYADFAQMIIPSGRVKLCGILQRRHIPSVDGESYIIVMRDEKDCKVD